MKAVPPPAFLKRGDTIGIAAPARPVTEQELRPFVSLAVARGYSIKTAPHLHGSRGPFSGTVQEQLADLYQLFTDPGVKAVFAARGGYGAARLLSGMDWEVIRENPRWLVGFSDVTALHGAFGKFMQTLHGAMPYSMVMEPPQDQDSIDRLFAVLEGVVPEYVVNEHPLNVTGYAEGPVTGGNLSVLQSLAGTPYEPDYEGSILFLEDLDEYLYHADRMILNFELRDLFKKISGLVVGSFSGMHDNTVPFGRSAYEIIADRAEKYRVPTMFGFPAGHEKQNFPLIFGRPGTLTVKKGSSSLLKY